MPRIDADESFAIVRQDLVEGLGKTFAPMEGDDSVAVAKWFADEEVIANERVAAVPWSYRSRHTGDFQGLLPTNRPLLVEGVTFVDRRRDEVVLHRYVDWAGVIQQLGLDVSWRVPTTEEEYEFGRRAREAFEDH
jgi:hypothetical protein